MQLTRNGSWALGVAVISLFVGRLLGLTEFFVLAAVCVSATAIAAISVRWIEIHLEIGREVRPRRVPAGGDCHVELRIRNRGSRATPVLTLEDPVGDGQRSRLRLAPLPTGEARTSGYRLPANRRGVLTIGPMSAVATDPLGLWRKVLTTKSTIDVIVLPRIHDLAPLPPAPGDEPDPGVHHLRTLATANEEFAALRDYRPGDDVRKVHWPSTARAGTPIVRHYDEPWQRRTTVVVDLRVGHHTTDSFERAVSAAASVVQLCADRHELVRLVTTSGHDTGFIGTDHEVSAAIDLLAAAMPSALGSLTGTMRALIQRRSGGALVTCTGPLGDNERSVLTSMGSLFGIHVAVCTAGRVGTMAGVDGPTTQVVAFVDDDDLERPWRDAVTRLAVRGLDTPDAAAGR
jgi:uncharacterized protein (DUF58 family)